MAIKALASVSGKDVGTRDAIVEILGSEFPLSAKQIYHIVAKHHGKNVTYHAVYKAISSLLGEKILSKHGFGYSLNKAYVKELSDFAGRAGELYFSGKSKALGSLREGDSLMTRVGSEFEMGLFILDILAECSKDELIAIMWPTVWPSMDNVPEMHSKIEKIAAKTSNVYIVSASNSFLDKVLAKRWEQMGVKVKMGVNLNQVFDVFCFNDFVIIFLQPRDQRYSKYKYFDLIKHPQIENIFNYYLSNIKEKEDINCILIKNSSMAGKIKEEVLSCF